MCAAATNANREVTKLLLDTGGQVNVIAANGECPCNIFNNLSSVSQCVQKLPLTTNTNYL